MERATYGRRVLLDRLLPVLVFLTAMTALADLADEAQLFDVLATRAARLARGRTPLLFGLVVVLATATTAVLSLDTTAVLLTPVVLALAQRLSLDPWPFALTTVWLANTASLFLPVSNLTNLLAQDRLGLSPGAFARELAAPAAVAVLVTVSAAVVLHRRHLTGRYGIPAPVHVEDRVLLGVAAVACAALAPALLLGAPVALAAVTAALALGCAFAVRRPRSLTTRLLPWRLVLATTVLFALVDVLGPHGLDALLRKGIGEPLQTALVAAGGSNLVNNLPAYAALERVVPHDQVTALLLGVNLGPLVTPWGSLATLLWADRCRARGVAVRWRRFVLSGMVLAPLLVAATVASS